MADLNIKKYIIPDSINKSIGLPNFIADFMIKKITIEKIYWFLIIVIIGIWGAVNMLLMEHDSLLTTETPALKFLFGLLVMLLVSYTLINYRYIHLGKSGIYLGVLCIYMAITRIGAIPYTASTLSYFYQPMLGIISFVLYLSIMTMTNKSDELYTFFTTWIVVGLLIIAYFYVQNWRYVNEDTEYHMASAYWALFLLPVLLYSPKKWLHYVGIALVGAMLFASFKRGGILAFGMGLFVFLIVKDFLIGHKFKKIIYFIGSLVVLIVIFYFVDNALDNVYTERFLNIKNDGGSNRDQVWATTWKMIQQSDLEHLLLGHGFSAVLQDSPLGLSAHNDFLESLYDFGICGSIFYILLHISLIKQAIRNIRLQNQDAAIMAFTYTFFLVLSMISHVLIFPWFAFMGLSWGLGSASEQKALVS